ncbi:hypothetical protein DMUE_6031 [Dictyocoela muelleri]|nr:hypothetical protein DMUE_6031 [Dictyocoela muelleri]
MNDNFLEFIVMSSNLDFFNYLISKRLILDEVWCVNCGVQMILKPTRDTKIGFNWRCLNYQCSKYQTTLSIFKGSFFEKSKMNPREILKVIYYIANNEILSKIMIYTNKSENSINDIKKRIYECIGLYWQENPMKLGGQNIIVQVDETKLNFNVRSHRGRSPRVPTWAITIVDTSTVPAKGYAEIVSRRDAMTLIPIIERVVRHGSIIYTDEWAAYNALSSNTHYNYSRVCHKYNFVDPTTGVHTQHVESFNNKLKYEIKKRRGILNDKKGEFLQYFLFCDFFKEKTFGKLLEILAGLCI